MHIALAGKKRIDRLAVRQAGPTMYHMYYRHISESDRADIPGGGAEHICLTQRASRRRANVCTNKYHKTFKDLAA